MDISLFNVNSITFLYIIKYKYAIQLAVSVASASQRFIYDISYKNKLVIFKATLSHYCYNCCYLKFHILRNIKFLKVYDIFEYLNLWKIFIWRCGQYHQVLDATVQRTYIVLLNLNANDLLTFRRYCSRFILCFIWVSMFLKKIKW